MSLTTERITLYLDGSVLFEIRVRSAPEFNDVTALAFGSNTNNDDSRPLNGLFDEIRLFAGVAEQSEVVSLLNYVTTVRPSNQQMMTSRSPITTTAVSKQRSTESSAETTRLTNSTVEATAIMSQSPAKASNAALIGGVVGAVLFVMFLVAIVIFLARRRRKQQSETDAIDVTYGLNRGNTVASFPAALYGTEDEFWNLNDQNQCTIRAQYGEVPRNT